MLELLVVADDLTGALDTGAQFARQGWRTAVGWGGVPAEGTEVWVLDTESRDLPAPEAARRVAELAAPLIPQARRLYKKVDSTLRGNAGAELAALLEASGAPKAILAPAFPAQGRTTRDGRQYVHGESLPATPFAQPLGDGGTIPALLRAQTDLTIGVVGLEVVRRGVEGLAAELQARAERILVVDAAEEGDLAAIAQALARVGPDWLPAGSAGLAAMASERPGRVCQPAGRTPAPPQGFGLEPGGEPGIGATSGVPAGPSAPLRAGDGEPPRLVCEQAPGPAQSTPAAWEPPRLVCEQTPAPGTLATGAVHGPILFVAGTLHPCLTRQIAHLQAQGRVTAVREVLGGLLVRGQGVVAERARVLGEGLLAGSDAILTTEGEPQVAGARRRVAALLAQVAGRALERAKPGALVLTGGDVAMAVCRALGAEAIAVSGELEPGIPVGWLAGGACDGLVIVTKAGGFGDDGVLCRIRSALR